MITSIREWLSLLQSSDAVIGFPLIAAGAVLMFAGWRLWRICTALSFALIGQAIGAQLAGSSEAALTCAIVGAVVLGVASSITPKYSISLLGGLIAAGLIVKALSSIGVSGVTLWAIGGVVLVGGTAFATNNRQHVVVVVTSLIGASLAMSGLAALLMAAPSVYAYAQQWLASSVIVVPFLLLVPTVVSCFHQEAEMNRVKMGT